MEAARPVRRAGRGNPPAARLTGRPGSTPTGRTFGIQIDHANDWQHLGPTSPANSDPLCNRHNVFKNNGYRITRDEHGHWHTHRPDGTEIRPT